MGANRRLRFQGLGFGDWSSGFKLIAEKAFSKLAQESPDLPHKQKRDFQPKAGCKHLLQMEGFPKLRSLYNPITQEQNQFSKILGRPLSHNIQCGRRAATGPTCSPGLPCSLLMLVEGFGVWGLGSVGSESRNHYRAWGEGWAL